MSQNKKGSMPSANDIKQPQSQKSQNAHTNSSTKIGFDDKTPNPTVAQKGSILSTHFNGEIAKLYAQNRQKIANYQNNKSKAPLSSANIAIGASAFGGAVAYAAAVGGYSLAGAVAGATGIGGSLLVGASASAGLSALGGIALGAAGGFGILAAGAAIVGVGRAVKSGMDAFADSAIRDRESIEATTDKSKTKSRALTAKERQIDERVEWFNSMLDKAMGIKDHGEREKSLSHLAKLDIPAGSKSLFRDALAKHSILATTNTGEKIDQKNVKKKIEQFSKDNELGKIDTLTAKSRVGLVPGFTGKAIKEGREDFIIGRRNELMLGGLEKAPEQPKEVTPQEKAFDKMLAEAKTPSDVEKMFDFRAPSDERKNALHDKYAEMSVNANKQYDANATKENLTKFAEQRNLGEGVGDTMFTHAEKYVDQLKNDMKMTESGEHIGFKEPENQKKSTGVSIEERARAMQPKQEIPDIVQEQNVVREAENDKNDRQENEAENGLENEVDNLDRHLSEEQKKKKWIEQVIDRVEPAPNVDWGR